MVGTWPDILLIRPQMAENIGAAARAMANFGLNNLCLVAPRDPWPSAEAERMSSGALAHMPPVRVFNHLKTALSDYHFILATTARQRDMAKPALPVRAAIAEAKDRALQGQRIGILFGPERTGLENDELNHAHLLAHIPVDVDFPSLNLAQAVNIVAYEWMQTEAAHVHSFATAIDPPAPHQEFDEFIVRLLSILEDRDFFKTEGNKPIMKRNLRNALLRGQLSSQEIKTLHGVLTCLTAKP